MAAARHRQRRLHPHDRAAAQARRGRAPPALLRRRRHRARPLQRQVLRVAARSTTPTTSCSTASCARSTSGRSTYFEEENYFFRLSRFQDRLLDWYAAHPGAIVPEFRGNEALGLIRGGLRDFSVSRTSLSGASRCRGIPKHVAYVWFDALTNYLAAVGFGDDSVRLHRVVAGRLPPDRQGHHPPPLRVLAGDADVGRRRAAEGLGGRRLPADRRREDEQDHAATSSARSTSSTRSASTASATTSSPTRRTARTATSPYDGLIGRYNSDLANNLGNLVSRVATVVEKKCGGIGPAPNADSPLADGGRRPRTPCRTRRGTSSQPSRALEATWQLIRATNAHLEANEPWKADPGPRRRRRDGRRPRGAADRGDPRLPAIPATGQMVWERIGLAGDIADQRLRRPPRGVQYPGGLAVTKGEPLFPRITHRSGRPDP